MIIVDKLLTREEWLMWLTSFADSVNNKLYKKCEYSKWKLISKPVSDYCSIDLDDNLNVCVMTGAHNPVYFKSNDNSLGEFLFKNVLTFNLEEQNMSYVNSYGDSVVSFLSSADKALNTNYTYLNGYTIEDTCSSTSISSKIDSCPTYNEVNEMIEKKIYKKENENMKGFNFDFGPCTADQVRMSMYGIAVKNAAGTYVSYDPSTNEVVDVDILNFDGSKYIYKIPVAIKDICLGDVIIHNRKPMFVIDLPKKSNNVVCIDVCAGEQKIVIPTTTMFGFNFITKIVSLFDVMGMNTPTADQPFGNMLPLMMLSGDNKDIDPMMMMFMMNQGDMNFNGNPMMMYLLFKDNKNIDPMALFALSGAFNPPHQCQCCGNN